MPNMTYNKKLLLANDITDSPRFAGGRTSG